MQPCFVTLVALDIGRFLGVNETLGNILQHVLTTEDLSKLIAHITGVS